MKYLANLAWGIVIYAITYLSWNIFSIYGFTGGILPRAAEIVVLVVVATVAGRALNFRSWKDILPYSLFWAFTVGVLDAIVTMPYAGVQMYSNWNLWIGYALVVLLPLVAPLTRIHQDDVGSIS